MELYVVTRVNKQTNDVEIVKVSTDKHQADKAMMSDVDARRKANGEPPIHWDSSPDGGWRKRAAYSDAFQWSCICYDDFHLSAAERSSIGLDCDFEALEGICRARLFGCGVDVQSNAGEKLVGDITSAVHKDIYSFGAEEAWAWDEEFVMFSDRIRILSKDLQEGDSIARLCVGGVVYTDACIVEVDEEFITCTTDGDLAPKKFTISDISF